MSKFNFEPMEDLLGLRNKAFGLAVAGALILAAGFFTGGRMEFFRSYLIGWLFALGVAMGLVGLSFLNHLAGGYWGILLRRVFEASGRVLPIFIVLGIPILFGLDEIYPWAVEGVADPSAENYDILTAHKTPFLNVRWFTLGSLIYLGLWSFFGWRLASLSARQDGADADGAAKLKQTMARWSAAGIIIYVLSGTFASVHWIMSVDPHWFSSLFGAAFVAGQTLSAWAFSIIILTFLLRRKLGELVPQRIRTKVLHDYGKLMLAFTAVWAYFMMSQYLIIWSANLPEEVVWYIDRSKYGWKMMSVALVVGHFVIPFLFLLSQDLKKDPKRLIWVAVWVLSMRWFDIYWLIAPSTHREGVSFAWFEPGAGLAFFGLWLGLMLTQLGKRPILPEGDPELEEVLHHG